jgi:Fe-S-cluster containining protein
VGLKPVRKAKKITANFVLKINDDSVPLSATVPDEKVNGVEMIPVYQRLTNDLVEHSVTKTLASGKSISCKAGCGACCAQAVPVMGFEAFHLADVVKRMSAAKQTVVRQHFADGKAILEEAGLMTDAQNIDAMSEEQRRVFGDKYFKLGMSCPFLENGSCSIYLDRPIRCREFLVTSDAKYCAQLNPEKIEHIETQLSLIPALNRLSRENITKQKTGWMLMNFTLDWAKSKKHKLRKKHGGAWLQEFIQLAIK